VHDAHLSEGNVEVNRSHEMLRHIPMIAALYSVTGGHIQSNTTAKQYYVGDTSEMTLEKVIGSCMWEEQEEGLEEAQESPEALLARIKALRLGDATIKMLARKHPRVLSAQQGGADEKSASRDPFGRWHEISFIPTIDNVTGGDSVMVVEVDVSLLEGAKRAEVQLRAAVKQQEQFFASVSHELRTPLNGIIGLTQYLIEGDGEEDAGATGDSLSTLKVILQAGLRLNLLINDILDSAALKEGTLQIKQERVDVGDAMSRVCKELLMLCHPGVELKHLSMGELPHALGDTQRICQILTNLIGNALKFTHEGTVEVWASVLECGSMMKVNVKDTGIGIAKDNLDMVFLPFQQADMSAQRRYEGTGLGLSLVQQLVYGHGGDVSIDSEVGKGTTIGFTLMVHSGEESDERMLRVGAARIGAAQNRDTRANGRSRPSSSTASSLANWASAGRHSEKSTGPEPEAPRVPSGAELLRRSSGAGLVRRSSGVESVKLDASFLARMEGLEDENKRLRQSVSLGSAGAAGGHWGAETGAHGNETENTAAAARESEEVQGPEIAGPAPEDVHEELRRTKELLAKALSQKSAAVQELSQVKEQLRESKNALGVQRELMSQMRRDQDRLHGQMSGQETASASTAQTRRATSDSLDSAFSTSDETAIQSDGGRLDPKDNTAFGSDSMTVSTPQRIATSTSSEAVGERPDDMPTHFQLHHKVEVLSIDDTPTNHLVIERILRKAKYTFTTCLDGMSALKLIEDRGYLPDIVLLDVMMPGMSGHEVSAQLQERYPTKPLPIVMLSAKTSNEDVLEGFKSGCLDYVCKPFDRRELYARIQAHLRHAKLQAQSDGTAAVVHAARIEA